MVHKKFTRGHWHTIFTSKMEKNRTLWAQEIWENSLLSKCDCFSSSLKPLGDLSLMPVWPSFVSFYWYQLLNGPALHILESFSVLAMRFFQVNVLSAVFLLPCWLEPKGKAKCLFSQLKGTAPSDFICQKMSPWDREETSLHATPRKKYSFKRSVALISSHLKKVHQLVQQSISIRCRFRLPMQAHLTGGLLRLVASTTLKFGFGNTRSISPRRIDADPPAEVQPQFGSSSF